MEIYVIILIIIALECILINPSKSKTRKKIFVIITFGILTIIAAIRDSTVGVDTEQFCNAFEIISQIPLANAFNLRYEEGFVILCKILSYITMNRQILIVMSSLIIFPMIGFFVYKNSKDVVLSSILYIIMNTYAMHMNVMRQAIAISLVILAYEMFLKKDKIIKYILLIFLASFFHQTAIIMVVLIFFRKIKYTYNTYFLTIIVGIVVFILANTIWNIATSMFPTYVGYANTEYIDSSYIAGSISAIIAWVVLTMGVFFERKNKNKDVSYNFLAFMVSILFIIDLLVIKINLFVRLATYFGFFTMIWLSNTLHDIKDKNERILMKYLVLVCFIVYWIIISVYRPEWYGVIPYNTFI